MRRQHWALCCNLDVAAHDTRVNTFVEVQNHILMDVVHVHPSGRTLVTWTVIYSQHSKVWAACQKLREVWSRIDTGMIQSEPLGLPFRVHMLLVEARHIVQVLQEVEARRGLPPAQLMVALRVLLPAHPDMSW